MNGLGTRKPQAIEVRSIVSGRNLEPYIEVVLLYDDGSQEQVTQWTPDEALHHARAVHEVAEEARSDAFLISWAMEEAGVSLEQSGSLLAAFRRFRQRRRAPEQAQ